MNAQFVAGSAHPSIWSVTWRNGWYGCEVSDQAPLKDCTTPGFRQGPNDIDLGGRVSSTVWLPASVTVSPSTSDREFEKYLILNFHIPATSYSSVHLQATERLNILFRSANMVIVRFVPVYGGTGYNIVARNTQSGAVEGKCDTASYTCEISGLQAGSRFTLWLRACRRNGYRYCDLRALPFDMSTLPGGTFRYYTSICD